MNFDMMSVGGGSMAGVSEASGGSRARQISGSGTSDDDASANGSEVQI